MLSNVVCKKKNNVEFLKKVSLLSVIFFIYINENSFICLLNKNKVILINSSIILLDTLYFIS